jgi:hypothetical protein
MVVLPNGWKEHLTLSKAQVSQLNPIRRHWQKQQARATKHTQQVA